MRKITFLAFLLLFSVSNYAQLSEGFEGATFPPTDWTVESTNTGFTWEPRAAGLVGQDATVNWNYGQDESLITPVFTIPASNPVLTFKLSMSYYWGVDPNNNYDFLVSVSTDGGASWTAIWDETALGVFTSFQVQDVTVPLTAYAGSTNAKLKFQYIGDDGATLYFDEVNVVAAPTSVPNCATLVSPADMVTGVTVGTVNFSWNAPTTGEVPTSYNFYAGTTLPLGTADLVGNFTTTTATLTVPAYDTTFYWMAVPVNLAGEATGCTPFSFTTQSVQPYCLYAVNGQYPTAAFTPTLCDGTTEESITAFGYAGEYSVVNVTSGNTYTFTSTMAGDIITISADGGQTAAAYGASPVVWTATVTGPVRFYTNLNDGACGDDTSDRTRAVTCAPLSTDSFDANKLQFYPNPVKNVLNLSYDKNISNVKITNMLGQTVYMGIIGNTSTQIDMSQFSTGAYFVKVTAENAQTQTIKVIKE